jgi:REP element-mobilizing transposase RayT
MVLVQENSQQLFSYLSGILKNKNCFVYSVNGISDHLHLLSDIHPSIPLADLMRDLKASSSLWIKKSGIFPLFESWAEGYSAFSVSWADKNRIIDYIKNQQVHHLKENFEDELRRIILENGIEINELYFP